MGNAKNTEIFSENKKKNATQKMNTEENQRIRVEE